MQRSCSGHMLVIFRKVQGDCCVWTKMGSGERSGRWGQSTGDQGEDLAYTLNDMGSHRRGIMGFKGVTLYLCTGVMIHAAEKSSKELRIGCLG